MELVTERVQARLSALGLSPTEAARRADLERTFIANLLQGKKRGVRGVNLARVATTLRCSPEYLTGQSPRVGSPPSDVLDGMPEATVPALVTDMGAIERGVWRPPYTAADDPGRAMVQLAPDPRFARAAQAAMLVRGDDYAELGYRDHDWCIVIQPEEYEQHYGALRRPDLIVVGEAARDDGLTSRDLFRTAVADGELKHSPLVEPAALEAAVIIGVVSKIVRLIL